MPFRRLRALIHYVAHPLCPMGRVFRNPHHLSGVLLARFLTNLGLIVWATLVVATPDALKGSRYGFINFYVNEDVLGWLFGVLGVVQMGWLWSLRAAKGFWHDLGYATACSWWSFVFFWQLFDPFMTQTSPYPTATSLSAVIAFAAFYAFLDGEIKEGGNAAPA